VVKTFCSVHRVLNIEYESSTGNAWWQDIAIIKSGKDEVWRGPADNVPLYFRNDKRGMFYKGGSE
jgi:hypothetical protein